MMSSKRVIIDTDPGVDDALALILALRSPELHVEAITVVNGNVSLKQCTENTLRVLDILEPAHLPPVVAGADRPLERAPFSSESIHGRDGLGEISLLKGRNGKKKYPPPRTKPLKAYAPDLLCELAARRPGEIALITIGPLTNVALALTLDPAFKGNIKEIISMGGAYAVPGNVTPAAEFNYYCDPEAARQVINSGIPMTLVGLDVTRSARLSRVALMRATKKKTRLNRFLQDSTERVMNVYRERKGYHGCSMHDALAVMAAIDPSFVGTKFVHVDIETEGRLTAGMSVTDFRPFMRGEYGKPNAHVAVFVDPARFQQFLLERIADA
jgi:inosine-uridine nucleoside N-ribohydrolase